ncbi:tRNA-binding protein [Dehalogenimonas sp. 4OHTPN]|uniref:tRNA-binding protein n=1 Tax=Dehalogenimonas sp. 4OHTPN TaxID=3166643 RepID=A0AAU8G8V3_9CHLR
MIIDYTDFERVDIRAGRVLAAKPFPEARNPAYRLQLDFGELGVKQSSAQITGRYACEELVGRTLLAVVNLPPKRIAGFVSEVLVLGVVSGDIDVVLVAPDFDVAPGARLL